MRGFHSFDELYRQLQLRKIPFIIAFFVVMLISYGVLYAIDFIPEPVEETKTTETIQKEAVAEAAPEIVEEKSALLVDPLPISIYFESLDKEVRVLNPVSSDLASLDEALLSGAVRHPESATLAEDGNIFILAHSSYLPNVLNKNFQAFNNIQKLTWGDKIYLRSGDTEYIYRVKKVYEDEASELFVPYTPGEARLTLATCNVLGAKEDRYMVEAELITSQKLQ